MDMMLLKILSIFLGVLLIGWSIIGWINQSIRLNDAVNCLVSAYAYRQKEIDNHVDSNVKVEFRNIVERYPLQGEVERLVFVHRGIIPNSPLVHLDIPRYLTHWRCSNLKDGGFGMSGMEEK